MSEKTTFRYYTINKPYGQSLAKKYGGTFKNGIWEIEVEKGSSLEAKIIQITKDNSSLTPYEKTPFFDNSKNGEAVQFQMPDSASSHRFATEFGGKYDGFILTVFKTGSIISDGFMLSQIKKAGGMLIL